MLRRGLLALVILAVLPGAARADEVDRFAAYFQVDRKDVDEVRGFELPPGKGYTHLLVGRFATTAEHHQHGVVVMRCDTQQCRGTPVYLEVDTELDVLGLVDLAGSPTPLTGGGVASAATGSQSYAPIPRLGKGKLLAWPALVLETRRRTTRTGATRFRDHVTGVEYLDHLIIVPLRYQKDQRLHWIFRETTVDRGIGGAGATTSYRLDRGTHEGALDIVATEHRHDDDDSACLPPEPTEQRFVLAGGRYVRVTDVDTRGGCH